MRKEMNGRKVARPFTTSEVALSFLQSSATFSSSSPWPKPALLHPLQ